MEHNSVANISWRKVFKEGGDFFQRLSGWTWFLMAVIAVLGSALAFWFSKSQQERFVAIVNNDLGVVFVLALFIFLIVLILFLIVYAILLNFSYTAQTVEKDRYAYLAKAFETFDEQFFNYIEEVNAKPEESSPRREAAVKLLVLLCRECMLQQIPTEYKRVAFFETNKEGTQIAKALEIGLDSEHIDAYMKSLVRDGKIIGVAGRAIATGKVEYEQNTLSPIDYIDPLLKFVAIDNSSIASIAAKSVMVGPGQWAGVLCVDCEKTDVFSKQERETLELFAKKIRLLYSIPPLNSHQTGAGAQARILRQSDG